MSFRRTGRRWASAAALLLLALVLVAVALGATKEQGLIVRAVLGAAAVVCVWLSIATVRQDLHADAAGVHVRNLSSSFSVPWSEIDHFEPPPPMAPSVDYMRHSGIGIVTTDGRHLSANLWARARASPSDFADHVVADLTRLHERYR
jgi:hypothetical protein